MLHEENGEEQEKYGSEVKGTGARSLRALAHLTVQQHHRLLERQRVPDLHLAVGALATPPWLDPCFACPRAVRHLAAAAQLHSMAMEAPLS